MLFRSLLVALVHCLHYPLCSSDGVDIDICNVMCLCWDSSDGGVGLIERDGGSCISAISTSMHSSCSSLCLSLYLSMGLTWGVCVMSQMGGGGSGRDGNGLYSSGAASFGGNSTVNMTVCTTSCVLISLSFSLSCSMRAA